MKKLIIVRGIPGSGKSTFSEKLNKDLWEEGFDSTHLESDMFFMKNGQYMFDPKKLWMAHKWCFDTTFKKLETLDAVIVSNTFTTLKELKPYIDKATELGYQVVVYRMANEFQNVHDVPEATLQAMKDRFEDYEDEVIIKAN